MTKPLPLGRVVATPGAWKLLSEIGGGSLRLSDPSRDGRLGRSLYLRPPPERGSAARWLPRPQLLPGRRGAHLDHHRGRQGRHYHPTA